ncbi:MAG: sirohydrochlorin chelatase [Actinomycetota bacterium]|nr:sirohydrochlorin chelatase [Actinomycetota bacterium]
MLVPERSDDGIQLPAPARRGPERAPVGVLLVGHGSRSRLGAQQMHRIADAVAAARPGMAIELGFLEMSDPPATLALDDLVARGCRQIVVLPLLLLGAGHAKSDVPAVVIEGRERHPHVAITYGSPLGVTTELVAIAGANVAAAVLAISGTRTGGAPRGSLPLLVVARGTSDPDANAQATRAARLVAEWHGSTLLHVGFTGMTWPSVPDSLEQMAALTPGPFAVFFWFLCHGRLIERARRQIAAFQAASDRVVVDAGYLGPDPALVAPVLARIDEALDGVVVTNCDTCRFRAAFPGHGDDVGHPVGAGHSHLALEHRNHADAGRS